MLVTTTPSDDTGIALVVAFSLIYICYVIWKKTWME